MSKVPTVRRLVVEDFPDQKKWIGRLFDILNTFIINVVQGLSNQLTISENMLAQVDRVRVRTALSYTADADLGQYAELFEPAKYAVRFRGTPVFVILGSCVEVAGNKVVNFHGTTVDWSYQDGVVTINAVSGLKTSKQYDLVLYTSGG